MIASTSAKSQALPDSVIRCAESQIFWTGICYDSQTLVSNEWWICHDSQTLVSNEWWICHDSQTLVSNEWWIYHESQTLVSNEWWMLRIFKKSFVLFSAFLVVFLFFRIKHNKSKSRRSNCPWHEERERVNEKEISVLGSFMWSFLDVSYVNVFLRFYVR